MAFNSLSFFIFLPLAAVFYYRLPAKRQNLVLLVASIAFYLFSSPELIFIMLGASVVTYFSARAIASKSDKSRRKTFIAGTVLLVACLCFFKYANLFLPLLEPLWAAGFAKEGFRVAMPLGISFYTFTAIAYLADVYAGRTDAKASFLDTLLFLCFFGTVSSGPILRANQFFSQVKTPRCFNPDRLTRALGYIGVGLLYKVALSDLLAVYVNAVYANLSAYTGLTIFAATVFYGLQLYTDFAGYSLLAMGVGGVLGLDIPRNFNTPYFARSLKEFWSRWHISLSSWLRDYIYIPLGGNRNGRFAKYRNIILTFALSGVWHGVGLPFFLWGVLHGLFQVTGDLFRPVSDAVYRFLHLSRQSRIANLWQWLCTMLLVNELWVFFRAKDLSSVFYVFKNQFVGISLSSFIADFSDILLVQFNPKPLLCLAFAAFVLLAFMLCLFYDTATRFFAHEGDIAQWLTGRKFIFRWLLYYLTAGLIFGGYLLNNGYFATAMSFIYNNF